MELSSLLPEDPRACTFNAMDGPINRQSHTGPYEIDATTGRPMSPLGPHPSGNTTRGVLPHWGPNHEIVAVYLEFHAHTKTITLVRDARTRRLVLPPANCTGEVLFAGIVDTDPRNTSSAWVERTVVRVTSPPALGHPYRLEFNTDCLGVMVDQCNASVYVFEDLLDTDASIILKLLG
jgi:hypothetical protein